MKIKGQTTNELKKQKEAIQALLSTYTEETIGAKYLKRKLLALNIAIAVRTTK